MTPDALIFDCDGTLVDSEGLQAEVFSEFAAAMGGELSAADALAAVRPRHSGRSEQKRPSFHHLRKPRPAGHTTPGETVRS